MLDFGYHRPTSLDAATSLLAADENALPLGGGQTLLPVLRARLAAPSQLVDLGRLPELKGISQADGWLSIGAGETHAAVAGNQLVRSGTAALARLAGGIGDPQVRNRGTIGGSIANNDPAACYPAAMLALGARIHSQKRRIEARDFFTGLFTTALEPGELVVRIDVPVCTRACYVKLANPASRFALIGVFHAFLDGTHRIAVTGAGNGVFRWTEGEAFLDSGGEPDGLGAVALDAANFTSDLHGSVAYRQQLVRVATMRALSEESRLPHPI